MLAAQVKYLVDANFAAPALMIAMSKSKYDALPEDLRKIIDAHTGGDFSMTLARFRDVYEAEPKQDHRAGGDRVGGRPEAARHRRRPPVGVGEGAGGTGEHPVSVVCPEIPQGSRKIFAVNVSVIEAH